MKLDLGVYILISTCLWDLRIQGYYIEKIYWTGGELTFKRELEAYLNIGNT